MSQAYNLADGPKLALLFRDNPRVYLRPMREAFASLGFEKRERNVKSGESERDVLEFFHELAKDESCKDYRCLAICLSGCYNATDGWGINVSGLDIDFDRLMEPFCTSPVWRGKPKLLIVQYENEAPLSRSKVCCDAGRLLADSSSIASGNGLPVFADTALVLGYGGAAFSFELRDVLVKYGAKLEFHQLMTLVNRRVQQLPVEPNMSPFAVGFVSSLARKLFFAEL